MSQRILIADDVELDRLVAQKILETNNYKVELASSAEEARQKLSLFKHQISLVLLDYNFGNESGSEVARSLIEIYPQVKILIYSGDTSRDVMKASWRAGAVGFVEKGEGVQELLRHIRSTLGAPVFQSETKNSVCPIHELGLVGVSAGLTRVAEKVKRYATLKENVLILGETGTGKENVAKALHGKDRAAFIAVNCAAYSGSADLLESDLFGYVKGAFTGALKDHAGVFESAQGGTVFLDEVHTLDLKAQQKLLRVLQEKAVRPVGASKEFKIEVRILAAAKPEIIDKVETGHFIADLYERLNVLTIQIPPLRDRIEDLEPLVKYFCEIYESETGIKKTISAATIRCLERYHWPRNIRELQNQVRRLCIDVNASEILPEHLDVLFHNLHKANQLKEVSRSTLESTIRARVKKMIESGFSQRKAARELGVPESSLRRMMKKNNFGTGVF